MTIQWIKCFRLYVQVRWGEAVIMLLLGLLSAVVHIPALKSFLSEYQLT